VIDANQGAGHANHARGNEAEVVQDHFLVAQLQVEMNLHKTLCHFLVAQLQDLEPNVSRKH
jgi:hypothetical protein